MKTYSHFIGLFHKSESAEAGEARRSRVLPSSKGSARVFRDLQTGGGNTIRVMREDAFQRAVDAANNKTA